MKKTLARWVDIIWYEDVFIATWLTPLTMLFADLVRFRRFLYRLGLLKSTKLSCPVIVVGNISVGGTGKTPFTIWLAHFLSAAGYKPGIVSRGYGGHSEYYPLLVSQDSDPNQVGDEALLLAQHSHCPVAVAPKRVAAAQYLLKNHACNIILADDGLQHYALKRDIEIAIVDGKRRFGNGDCLPGGPLREPVARLNEVDFIVVNGGVANGREISMQIQADKAINLATGIEKPLSDFSNQTCHALAGIGHPQRFFDLLTMQGLNCETHIFPDHHVFVATDLEFTDQNPVLMTEKDAVKCHSFAIDKHWYVPITVSLPDSFGCQLLAILQ